MIRFESTISLLRKLMRDFLMCFFNCVIKDSLITFFFWGGGGGGGGGGGSL